MRSKVAAFVEKHNLLNHSDLYIVALSGGADSVALLSLLNEMGYKVHAAHCNFHLRGAESDRDELFCETLCQEWGVPFHRVHFDTQTYAELYKVSIEMAARELRYRWFGQLCEDIGAAAVCVAHHRDDSVETVLLNLIRGTGLRGLTGMKPKTHTSFTEGKELCVIRPLLCVSRAEIEDFLTENGQKFVTDSTNLEADVLRNRIRLQVLPLLRALNPAVSENIQRTAENLREAQALLDSIIKDFCNRNTIELRDLTKYGSIEFIAFEWLKNYGFNGSQVRQIIDAETGKIVTSPTGYDVLKDRDRLLVERSPEPLTPLCIPEEGTYCWCNSVNSNAVNHEKNERRDRFVVRKQSVFVSKTPDIATVDAAKVLFPLTVRRVEEGDWMIPFGMKGRKLLSDLMTDRKMTAFDKRRQLVVVDACGNTVWLVGLRVDSRAAVDTSTQEVLVMHT